MYTFTSNSDEQTYNFGKFIGSNCFETSIITLNGQLGAGKTVLAKGIAKGLGINDNVTSPSFAILNIYSGKLPLYHFDLYRLSNIEEIYELGFDEYFDGDGVCLIEWANDLLLNRDEVLNISIEGSGDEKRKITINANGEKHINLLNKINRYMEKNK